MDLVTTYPLMYHQTNLTTNNLSSDINANYSATCDKSNADVSDRAVALILVIVAILTIMMNSVLLTAYAKFNELKTAFNTYLLSLSITDFLQAAVVAPGNALLYWTDGWPLGRSACTLFQYFNIAFGASIQHMHCVICLNRLLAVSYPVFYRNHHNKRVALAVCVGLCLYVNLWIVPELIMDHLFYRIDSVRGNCYINVDAQRKLALWFSTMLYDVPALLTFAAYPVIVYKVRQIHKNHRDKQEQIDKAVPAVRLEQNNDHICVNEPGQEKQISLTVPTIPESLSRIEPSRKASTLPNKWPNGYHQVSSESHLKILTLLVIGLLACWLPSAVNSHMAIATAVSDVTFSVFSSITTILFYANSLLNPVFYACASTEWRTAFKKVLHLL